MHLLSFHFHCVGVERRKKIYKLHSIARVKKRKSDKQRDYIVSFSFIVQWWFFGSVMLMTIKNNSYKEWESGIITNDSSEEWESGIINPSVRWCDSTKRRKKLCLLQALEPSSTISSIVIYTCEHTQIDHVLILTIIYLVFVLHKNVSLFNHKAFD